MHENSDHISSGWKLLAWNGRLHWFGIGPQNVWGGVVSSTEALGRVVRNLGPQGYNLYAHANPSHTRRQKARTSEITHWRYVVLDLDPYDPQLGPVEAVHELLALADTKVSAAKSSAHIVSTGRGAQAWIPVRGTPILGDTRTPVRVERAMGGFLHWLRAEWNGHAGYRVDTSTSDLARVVRLPGSVNHKTGRVATVVLAGTDSINEGELLAFADYYAAVEEVTRPAKTANLVDVIAHLNGRAREFLTAGFVEGERHKSAFAAAKALCEVGMPIDSAAYWVAKGGQLCRPKLSEGECRRVTYYAYGK